MKNFVVVGVAILLLSKFAFCFSYSPCTEVQKKASNSLSLAPTVLISFDIAAIATSQALWISSTSNKNGGAKSEEKDNDMTLYWILPSIGFEFGALMSIPACGSIEEQDGVISAEKTEKNIINNTRFATGISTVGQFVSLTNTLDEDKRQITRTLIGITLLNELLFELFWRYDDPGSLFVMRPFLNHDSQGFQFVYNF